MLTDDGFACLRMAASLAMALPTVRVKVSSPTRALAEVGWHFDGPPDPRSEGRSGPGAAVTRLAPCAFRAAVGRALRHRAEGADVDFCGLGDAPPVITIEVAEGERVLPGDIVQVRADDGGWHHVLATLLPPDGCAGVIGTDGPPVSFTHDPVTGVTLLQIRTGSPDPDRLPHLASHLTALRGRLLAEELISDPLVVR